MRILVLCNKPPYPPKDGGSLAIYTLISGLMNAGHTVKILAVNAPKYGVSLKDIPQDFKLKTAIELIDVNLAKNPVPALYYLIKGKSYQVNRFYNKNFAKRLVSVLKDGFDIVQLETVFPAVYLPIIRKYSTARIVLRAHNIENLIWKQLADNHPNSLKKWYLNKVAQSLKEFEYTIYTKVDGIAAITKIDAAYIELKTCKTPVISIPFGLDTATYPIPDQQKTENTIFHLAAMNWIPNEEGVKWFLENVWPLVVKEKINTNLKLAGKHMPEWIYTYPSEKLEIIGEVPDSWEFMCKNSIMIVPLFSGSGVRIKIIEGMLAGKTIVSTSKGAAGIDVTPNENILIANTPEEFATALLSCLKNPVKSEEIGKNARNFILKHHNINNIIPELTAFYEEL